MNRRYMECGYSVVAIGEENSLADKKEKFRRCEMCEKIACEYREKYTIVPTQQSLDGKLREILGELVGASSLCWNPRPTGIFDSGLATKFVNQAIDDVVKLLGDKK